MNLDFQTAGMLQTKPFAELAGSIHRRRLTGSVYLSDGRAERRAERLVYFANGEVYAAASNLAVDSALAILIRAGRVTQEGAARIQNEVATGRPFSEALVAYHCVSRHELNQLRSEHVKSIFNSLCEWTSGEYRFIAGDKVAGGNLGISTKALLLEGAQMSYVPRYFQEKMANPRTWVAAGDPLERDLSLPPFAYFLVSCLSQPRNVAVMTESGRMDESRQEIMHQLYALHCTGLVTFKEGAANPLRQQSGGLAQTAKPVQPQPAVPSMALALPLQEDPETTKRRNLETIKRDIKKIRQLLSSASDDYAILGLRAGASASEVKHSYRHLVNHYHPDRHHQHADTITLATLSEVLMAIRSAYETAIEHALLTEIISSNSQRYKATRPEPTLATVVSSIPAQPNSAEQIKAERITAETIRSRNDSLAEVKHRQALTHQARGEYEAAIGLMHDAVTLAPNCARYHGDLAALLERVPMRREQAEQHLLRATELEPGNLFYHLQLGSFYRAVGLLSRAEQQFVLALKIDPVDRAAAMALEEVASLKKTQVTSPAYGRKRVAKQTGFWSRIFGRVG